MIPVTLLTGFLGSGKTTLLSRLLRTDAFARTAVVMNEFGPAQLDHDIVAASTDAVVTLDNGCLCCRSMSDLAGTLLDLLEQRSRGGLIFDRVLVETSGLVDPVPVIHSLSALTGVQGAFSFAGVVTVVDGVLGCATLAAHAEARRQVEMADMLLVSKLDLAEGGSAQLTSRLAELNACAPIMDAREWTGQLSRLGAEIPEVSQDGMQLKAGHRSRYAAITLERDTPLPAAAVPLFLEGLCAHFGERLLRVKGLVAIAEAPGQMLAVHTVQHVIHQPEWVPVRDPGQRSTFVLIGRRISRRWSDLLLEAIELEVRTIKEELIVDRINAA